MDIIAVLGLSILLQFAAALFALKLIPVTGRKRAWILISAAICLMAVRRCFTFYREMSQVDLSLQTVDFATEWVSLGTSALMLAGIRYIAPVFLSMKRMMEALKTSEERYRTLFEDSNDAVFISSREGTFIDINPSATKLFGFDKGEMIGMDVRKIYVNPADRAGLQEKIEKAGAIRDYELLFKKKDGTQMDCTLTATVHRADDGTIQGYRGIIRDCTELKQTMALLEDERRRMFSLLNDLPGLVSLRARDYSIPYANSRFRERLGDPEGKLCYELLYKRDKPCSGCSVFDVLESKSVLSFEYLLPDGRIYQLCHYPFTDVDGSLLVLELAIDISDRKEAEKELKDSEARYRSLVDNMPDGLYLLGRDFKPLFYNTAMERIFGYPKEYFLEESSQAFPSCVHPDDRPVVLGALSEMMDGRDCVNLRYRIVRPDGEVRHLRDVMRIVQAPNGEVSAYQGIISDLTEMMRAEEALRESETRYRELVQNANSIILRLDTEGNITFFNEYAQVFFGYAEEEVIGRSIVGAIAPATETAARDYEAMLRDIVEHPDRYLSYESRNLRRNDEQVWIVWTSKATVDTEGRLTGILCIGNDITRSKQLETQYRMVQRLESVGRLAGGVAHDFNNLLTIILGYTEHLIGQLGHYPSLGESLEEIKSAGERGASLVRQLLAFSRKQLLQPRVIDLNAVISETEKMLGRLIGEDIELVTVFDPTLGAVRADPAQIEQIVLNLAVNARDAMPEGGRLTIETANVELDEAYATRHSVVTPGPYVMFAMSDTGTGMDEGTLSRIFEPFFTTKEEGKGTGLGLAGVYGTVKQSNGCIWVYSEPGQGTTFKIYLPRCENSLETENEVPTLMESLECSETILFVEDEEKLRAISCKSLVESGYTVLEASCGQDALRLHERHEGRIHLLVTDVVMPGMSGRELAERLVQLRPEMKVLYISGYTENAIVHHGVLDTGVEFLQKPFTPTTLLVKIRGVLEHASKA